VQSKEGRREGSVYTWLLWLAMDSQEEQKQKQQQEQRGKVEEDAEEEEEVLVAEDGAAGSGREPRLKGAAGSKSARNSLVVKVGMVGDAQIGKTSLMVRYVEGKFDSDYIETLGVNFMEKTITLKNAEVTFSIWDLGGEREFISMLPLVCNDAMVILFMFSLVQKSTLSSVREWYRQVRGLNKQAFAFLIGTKYDQFIELSVEEQKEVTKQARKFAKAMKAPLIFTSASHSINIQKLFKLIFSKLFQVDAKVQEIKKIGEPILEFQQAASSSS